VQARAFTTALHSRATGIGITGTCQKFMNGKKTCAAILLVFEKVLRCNLGIQQQLLHLLNFP